MKMQLKTLSVLLLLSFGALVTIQSCQKDPCEKPCENTGCDLEGTIAFEPGWCATPPGGRIGIMDDNGVWYYVNEDLTRSFGNYKEGDRVRFGYCQIKVISSHEGQITQIVAPELREITLGCIEKIEDNTDCIHTAEVVQVNYSPNTAPSVQKYVKIDGKVYVPRGQYAEHLLSFPAGSTFKVGYRTMISDCYLPAVITYPSIEGCVEITCFNSNITQH